MSSLGPLICAKFDPTDTYLASGIIALDTHQIKVQSINPSQSSLNTSFDLDKSSKLTNLTWISYSESILIAISLSKGSVLIYSPLTNEIVAELETPNNLSIQDFYYSNLTKTAWSSDIGGNIYEWELVNFKLLQVFKINDLLESSESINRVSTIVYDGAPHLLLGSHSIYLVNIDDKQIVKTFPGHIQPVNSIHPVPTDSDLFLSSAKGDRFINLYSITKNTTKAVFVSQSSILDISLGIKDDKSVLVIINENGNLEIFNDPLATTLQPATHSLSKKKRRQQISNVQSRSSNSSIKLSRPAIEIKSPADSNLVITSASVYGDSIIISWLENSNLPNFESIKWLDESGNLVLSGDKIIEKLKPDLKTSNFSSYGHDIAAAKHYNEGNAIVSDGANFKDLDNESEGEDEETLADKLEKLTTDQKPKAQKSNKKNFGGKNTTATLTVILSQSLKNNDHSLLETVLSNRDPQVIQSTISKLDSSLAVVLLDRLSERIQRQTSKFDQLNYWLKWIIIVHGGVLTSLPNIMVKLANLHSILIKKANTLPRLLELQGRLTMLYQQNELRKEILNEDFDEDSEEIDSDIEYIEELDNAGLIDNAEDEDMDMIEGHDDYVDSEMEQDGDELSESEESESEESEPEEGNIKSVMDLETPEDEENYSDVEIGVNNDRMIDDDEELERETDLRIKNRIKKLKSRKN